MKSMAFISATYGFLAAKHDPKKCVSDFLNMPGSQGARD